MPPKSKDHYGELKKTRSKAKTAIVPTTTEEYLAAGVDFEEAGEKWRGGDAAKVCFATPHVTTIMADLPGSKSTRFFIRAIDCYNEALQKFPLSFDLAYNKARAQYELTQYPKLLEQLPNTTIELLEKALVSSRYALALNPENPDILFNTAQVLGSIVEELDGSIQIGYSKPLLLLGEALSLFQKCLEIQEASKRDNQSSNIDSGSSIDQDSDGGVSIVTAEDSATKENRWANIIEPVTDDTLLDTILAILETLTTLSQMHPPHDAQTLETIQKCSTDIQFKFETYLTNKSRIIESHITRANFICAFATAKFRSSHIDRSMFNNIIENAYVSIDFSTNPEGLCGCAESLIANNDALRLHDDEADTKFCLELRWKALTKALEHLSTASKISNAENVDKIHLARGDVELLRYQLGQTDTGLAISKSNSTVFLKNAEKYYRGSATLMRNMGKETLLFEAEMKEALALGLAGDTMRLRQLKDLHQRNRSILEEIVEEGLVSVVQLKEMGVNID